MPRRLKGSVVVITGASSGIGRATAYRFADEGAKLVLAARREAPLKELAAECEERGARAIPVVTDVRDEGAVRRLSDSAVSQFGRLDVWVNNAGVSAFGKFADVPSEVFRNVLETNFFGYVHGIRAAIPHFRERGGGVIINNSSVIGRISAPHLSAYASSKFAIRGLGESLWEELRDEDIYVSTVSPASIDTPIFQHAANYSGQAVKPLEPIYDADEVARAIVRLALDPQRELVVGRTGSLLSGFRRLMPGGTSRAFARQVERSHFQDETEESNSGNVLDPDPHYIDVSGGWKRGGSGGRTALAVAGLAALPALFIWWRMRDGQAPLPAMSDIDVGDALKRVEPLKQSVSETISEKPWKRLWD